MTRKKRSRTFDVWDVFSVSCSWSLPLGKSATTVASTIAVEIPKQAVASVKTWRGSGH